MNRVFVDVYTDQFGKESWHKLLHILYLIARVMHANAGVLIMHDRTFDQ